MIAGAGGIDFQLRAVRPKPNDAAAAQFRLAPILAHRAVNALVARRQIEVAIHRKMQVGRNMIVKAALPRTRIGLEEVDWIFPDAILIAEDGDLRTMMDIELAFQIGQSEDGVQIC